MYAAIRYTILGLVAVIVAVSLLQANTINTTLEVEAQAKELVEKAETRNAQLDSTINRMISM